MKNELNKSERDKLEKEIKECTKILITNSLVNREFSWSIFWKRIDAHKWRNAAIRMLGY